MSKFALGQSVTRIEDAALLRGAGRYTDDFEIAGAAHACVLRSPHAHANILDIDTVAARKAPGVLAVLTGADAAADGLGDIPCLVPVTNIDGTPRADTPRPALALKRVRHVGDPVALVVAETLAQAKDAAELIEIDYEPLPAVADTRGATRAGTPRAWDHIPGNLCFDIGAGSGVWSSAEFTRFQFRRSRIRPGRRPSKIRSTRVRKRSLKPCTGPWICARLAPSTSRAVKKVGAQSDSAATRQAPSCFSISTRSSGVRRAAA